MFSLFGDLQPVPELADALLEMRWIISKSYETERLQSPIRSMWFFDLMGFFEAVTFAVVHGGDVRFARVFCELVGTVCQRSPYEGACVVMSTHTWRIALQMVKANTHDASIVLPVSTSLLFGLRFMPGKLHAVVEAGAIPIFASVVKSRAAVTDEGVDLAAALVKLLKTA